MKLRRNTRKKTANLFRRVIKASLQTDKIYTVSQWAEEKRVLDQSSNLSGRWSNGFTPYLVGIMDSLNDSAVREIYFCKATQIGGTEALINMVCYIADCSPSPTMIVYPTDDLAKDTSNDRLKPAFRLIPSVKKKFLDKQSKELELRFRGMNIYLRGAGSVSKLSSKPIKYLLFDEIDKLGGASKKEASPFALAGERTKTFKPQEKVFATSTPTLKTNYIWTLKENAEEERHFFVPCPHCGEMIELLMKNIIFSDDESLSIEERAATAQYVCPECGTIIRDGNKPKMLRGGEWRVVRKRGIGKAKNIAFWINSLYSIFLKWEDIALEFLKSKDDPEMLQNFVNSWLAEPWEDTSLKTTESTVTERQTDLPEFVVPEWTKMITGGVDVQETSFYYVIRGWGNYSTSQLITHGQVTSWEEIEEAMNREYEKESGEKMIVNRALIDSGYQPDQTYDFCIDNADWANPVKGTSNPILDRYKISKVDRSGSRAYGMPLFIVDGGKYKDSIASRMRRENGEDSGAWMVFRGCDAEYAKQVTAEHRVTVKAKNGKRVQRWVPKYSHADNHYLDCEVYAMAAAESLGIRSIHLEREKVEDTRNVESDMDDGFVPHVENWIGG